MSVRLAPGLCQPITPSLFRACVREWAVCSGLTDCFSVVGTLITAPTLSQASASLPPSLFFFFSSRYALQSAPSGPCAGPSWSEERRTRLENAQRDKTTQIWEHGWWEHTSVFKLPVLAVSWWENRPLIMLRAGHL